MTTTERLFRMENSLSSIKCITENALSCLENPYASEADIELVKLGLRTVIEYCTLHGMNSNITPKTPAHIEVELPVGLVEDESVNFNDAFEVYA